jgi:hypothetical protein
MRNDWALWRARDSAVIRLDIHPADLGHPRVARWWLDTLDRLARERETLTKGAWVARWE